jgi:hypothetical protein
MLTKDQILAYQKLFLQRFGVVLTTEQAYEQGEKLINLVELVLFKTAHNIDKSNN